MSNQEQRGYFGMQPLVQPGAEMGDGAGAAGQFEVLAITAGVGACASASPAAQPPALARSSMPCQCARGPS